MSEPLAYKGYVISTEVTKARDDKGELYLCSVNIKDSEGKPAYLFTVADPVRSPEAAEEQGLAAGRWRIDEGLRQVAR